MGKVSKAVVTMGVLLMAIGGCSKNDSKTVTIDHYVFNVPIKYLLQGTIPWLPASQHAGLTFYVNPDAPLHIRNSVSLQSTATTCPGNRPLGSNALAWACSAAAQKKAMERGQELEKIHPHDDPTQWEYRSKGGKGQGIVVATCSAMADGNGLCHSFSNYGDLVYSVGLRDSEIDRLPLIRKEIHGLLSLWEKPAH